MTLNRLLYPLIESISKMYYTKLGINHYFGHFDFIINEDGVHFQIMKQKCFLYYEIKCFSSFNFILNLTEKIIKSAVIRLNSVQRI